jgi:hypothetical protein
MEVSPEEKESRENYVTARSRAFDNLNEYLNEKSGAAVTEQEFNRLKRRMPNPGTGLISDRGDEPIEFNTKMRDVIETLKMAAARYRYLLSTGLTDSQIIGSIKKESIQSIGAFKAAINGRAKELTEELKEAGVDSRDIEKQVKAKIKEEFKL